MHPKALEWLYKLQSEKVNCINCNSDKITKGTHLDKNGGLSVFMKYTCQICKKEFLDKEMNQPLDKDNE